MVHCYLQGALLLILIRNIESDYKARLRHHNLHTVTKALCHTNYIGGGGYSSAVVSEFTPPPSQVDVVERLVKPSRVPFTKLRLFLVLKVDQKLHRACVDCL